MLALARQRHCCQSRMGSESGDSERRDVTSQLGGQWYRRGSLVLHLSIITMKPFLVV